MGRVFIRPAYYLLARTRLFAVPSKRCVLSPRKSIRSLDDSHQFFFFQRNEHPCITCKLPHGNFFLFFSFFLSSPPFFLLSSSSKVFWPPADPDLYPLRIHEYGNFDQIFQDSHAHVDRRQIILCAVYYQKKELDCNFKVKNS